LNNQYK